MEDPFKNQDVVNPFNTKTVVDEKFQIPTMVENESTKLWKGVQEAPKERTEAEINAELAKALGDRMESEIHMFDPYWLKRANLHHELHTLKEKK